MATATCTAFRGVLEVTGVRVGQVLLWERVGFWAGLSQVMTGALVASRWDEDSLDVLAGGVDERGEPLPSKGWMALRRLNWPQTVTPPVGVYVSDRVRRGAEEYAARTLRLALHRDVVRFVAHLSADPQSAEDLAQDTFLRALRSLHLFEGRSSARTWLLAIARRAVVDDFRRAAARPRLADAEDWCLTVERAQPVGLPGFEEGGRGPGAPRGAPVRATRGVRPHSAPRPALRRGRTSGRLPGRYGPVQGGPCTRHPGPATLRE